MSFPLAAWTASSVVAGDPSEKSMGIICQQVRNWNIGSASTFRIYITVARGWDTLKRYMSTVVFCRVRVQTVPEVFTPGITPQITSVSYVGRSYPYPEYLEILYDIRAYAKEIYVHSCVL